MAAAARLSGTLARPFVRRRPADWHTIVGAAREASMRRCLIVANETLGATELLEAVRERIEEDDCSVHVVVPATGTTQEPGAATGVIASGAPSSLPAAEPGVRRSDPIAARERAFERMKRATGRIEDMGATAVDGEVGDPDPLVAVDHAMENAGPFDEIIVSTLPVSISRWIRMDLASRLQRHHDVPVTHVEAEVSGGSA